MVKVPCKPFVKISRNACNTQCNSLLESSLQGLSNGSNHRPLAGLEKQLHALKGCRRAIDTFIGEECFLLREYAFHVHNSRLCMGCRDGIGKRIKLHLHFGWTSCQFLQHFTFGNTQDQTGLDYCTFIISILKGLTIYFVILENFPLILLLCPMQ